jgi:hypothetical protein
MKLNSDFDHPLRLKLRFNRFLPKFFNKIYMFNKLFARVAGQTSSDFNCWKALVPVTQQVI